MATDKKSTKKSSSSEPEAGDAASLEQVRNLLFGNQQKDTERRLQLLERRIGEECEEVRADLRARVESLEQFLKDEIAAVVDRLKGETGERKEAHRDLSKGLNDLSKSLEKRITKLDEQTSTSHSKLRQSLLDQSKELRDQLKQRIDEVRQGLDDSTGSLDERKVDRLDLAALLSDVAIQLQGEEDAG